MTVKILDKSAIAPMVEALMEDYRVVGPVAKGPQFVFEPIVDPSEIRLDYNTSVLPPKMVLQPPSERLVTIDLEGKPSAEPVMEAEPTVILGVHTCDLRAIRLLDEAFTVDYPDAHYLERRDKSLIVSVECLESCDEHSFCKDMGTMTASEGYDLHLVDVGGAYAVRVGTEAGAELLSEYTGTRPAETEDLEGLSTVLEGKEANFNKRLEFDADGLPTLMEGAYEHALWQELGDRCFACGSCTNVCPTCYCFNVVDTINLEQTEATRIRKWDSCQLDEFARVAGGENFREARAARQRHRFFRKGKYIYERFDVLGCVGCGRCIRTCLVHINIVDGFNEIYRTS